MTNSERWVAILPEVLLVATAIFTIIAEIATRKRNSQSSACTVVAFLGMAAALIATFATYDHASIELFSRSVLIDPISQYFKSILIFVGVIGVVLSWISREIGPAAKAEMQVLLALGTFGMCVVCSAIHLLLVFVGFEIATIACCVLAAFKTTERMSSEAGVKWFLQGGVTAVFLAIGIILIYGIGGTLLIPDIRIQLGNSSGTLIYLWLAFGLIFMAISTKMAVFPFHFLAPDAAQGAPSPASAFLGISNSIAGSAFLIRLCVHIFSSKAEMKWLHIPGFDWPQFIAGISAVTMTVGNLTALRQPNLKRLISCSCVAQMGYVLMALAASNNVGLSALLFYLTSYAIVTLGAIFVMQIVIDSAKSEDISALKGLVWKSPFEGVVFCIFLLSMAGLPPLIGFIGRFYILGVAIHEKMYWLALIGAVNWVIGLAYCLSMVQQIFAEKEGQGQIASRPLVHVALSVLAIPTVVFGIYWDGLMNSISRFLGAVLW